MQHLVLRYKNINLFPICFYMLILSLVTFQKISCYFGKYQWCGGWRCHGNFVLVKILFQDQFFEKLFRFGIMFSEKVGWCWKFFSEWGSLFFLVSDCAIRDLFNFIVASYMSWWSRYACIVHTSVKSCNSVIEQITLLVS